MASQIHSQRLVAARLKQLSTCPDEIIPKEKLEKFKVKMTSLDAEDPVCLYFRPLSVKFLEDHAPRPGSIAGIEKSDPDFFKIKEYDAEAARAASARQEKPSGHLPHALRASLRSWKISSTIFHVRISEGVAGLLLILSTGTAQIEHHTPDVPSDDSLMRHELGYILRTMEVRLEERLFAKDQPQPVLMISLIAEQQGRIIEAYIEDQSQIVVACSRLYSFAKNKDAPFELFYRWLLGDPIGMEPYPEREESEKD